MLSFVQVISEKKTFSGNFFSILSHYLGQGWLCVVDEQKLQSVGVLHGHMCVEKTFCN